MEKPTVGMTVRRSGARLRAMAKAHGPLHVLLWQAREAQSSLIAAASAQKTLFSDLAAWASSENRALSDVCSCVAELSSLYTAALAQLALAYKSFRKEMGLVLEGERRCDSAQRKLHDAENKRIKFRKQVLRAQNRVQTGEGRISGDFTCLQTQLSEAERGAERAHVEACNTAREQEAVKLVVVKAALSKLSESHLKLVSNSSIIFKGNAEIATEIPEPPPPGDPLSCIRYSGYDKTKALVQGIKGQVQIGNRSFSSTPNSSRLSGLSDNRPVSSSTPLTSPNNSSMWSPEPTAPQNAYLNEHGPHEPPPPYNMSYLSNASSIDSPFSRRQRHRNSESERNSSLAENDENSISAISGHRNSSLYQNLLDASSPAIQNNVSAPSSIGHNDSTTCHRHNNEPRSPHHIYNNTSSHNYTSPTS